MTPASLQAFQPLYDQICAKYGREQIELHMAKVLRRLIPQSSSVTPAELGRLLGVLDEHDGRSAQSLYEEWDEAYLQLSDDHDGDVKAHPEIYRGLEVSRLAAAVAEFTNKDCGELPNFSSMMYELAAGLDWDDEVLINVVQRELALC